MIDLINKPFEGLIGTIFIWLVRIVNNQGLALILLSLVVNVALLPFYAMAENLQKKERQVQQEMKPKIDEFKSVYKGYELHLYIKNVYRLHHYHPMYALRGLVSLFIQVPFFMGAYTFLSNYSGFQGTRFLFIPNLALPDQLITIHSIPMNGLPFLMTLINLISSAVYSVGMSRNEKITMGIIALFFLILLYDSPSSLLVYWTGNNVFSLFKNLYYKYKEAKLVRGEM